MNLKNIFNGKKSKSFAEQLAAVKSIFKSSYEQAIQLNSEIAEDTKELKRNDDVASYRLDLIHRCYPDADLVEKVVNKHTYEEMLQSSKPLEDIYWFTSEEIEEINNNYVSRLMGACIAEKIKAQ